MYWVTLLSGDVKVTVAGKYPSETLFVLLAGVESVTDMETLRLPRLL